MPLAPIIWHARRQGGAIGLARRGAPSLGAVWPVTYQINWEIQALSLAVGFLSDDPSGVTAHLCSECLHPAARQMRSLS